MAEQEPRRIRQLKLILASASPRRRALLAQAGISFEIRPSDVDEEITEPLAPAAFVEELARRKAYAADLFDGEVILGADTVVSVDDRILGKPQDREDAIQMLTALSGRSHAVYTGVCLRARDKTLCFSEATYVSFYPLTAEEIAAYVDTGEPMDKAGAYGIQERGCLFVCSLLGDYFNVMGLPVSRVARSLQAFTEELPTE